MKHLTFFESERLYLRQPSLYDAAIIFQKYAQDSDVTKYVIWKPHENITVTKEFLSRCIRCWEENTAFPFIIVRKEDEEIVGMIEYRIKDHSADFGYVIAKQYWGNGYATESSGLIVKWLLEHPSIYRVWAVCDVENKASARVLEKVGMQREGILRRYIMHPNISDEPRDCFCYALVK
jgi:ribosomal-protein-alanine N-acetyltransferase